MGIEPIYAEWKSAAYACRPGPHEVLDTAVHRDGALGIESNLSSRWRELNPSTPVWRTGVSPQHFTCLAVSLETCFANHRRRRSAFGDPCVGRVGIEPTFRRIKSPLQGLRLLPTHSLLRPTHWS